MSVTIYGASDDLVEIEGDINEEWDMPTWSDEDMRRHIGLSDGTLLSICRDGEGCWRINVLHRGKYTTKKTEATATDSDYTDRLEICGYIEWAVFGKAERRR